jgi:phage anti-repressor protein
MNFHPTNDYPINLDDVFGLIGFANKGNAMKLIKNNFVVDEDYKILLLRTEKQNRVENRGGHNKEIVKLNIDTFKNLCMITKTEKGKEIRKYYVKMENIYNELIKEELNEKNLELNSKREELDYKDYLIDKVKGESLLQKHNLLLQEFNKQNNIVYIILVKTINENNYVVKIGESRKGILGRYNEHKSHYQECIIMDVYSVRNSMKFEKFLHKRLEKYNYKLQNYENEKELFLVGGELSYRDITKTITDNINEYNDPDIIISQLHLEINELKKEII